MNASERICVFEQSSEKGIPSKFSSDELPNMMKGYQNRAEIDNFTVY